MTETASSPRNRNSTILRIAVLLGLVGGLFALFRFLPVAGWIDGFKVWVAGQGAVGVLAYALARTVLRERASRMAAASARFAGLNRAIEKEGGKIVALVRLSPLFPFTVVNYLFGLTPVRPLPYILASWVTMLPGTAAYVYFGSALGDAATGAAPEEGPAKA